MSSPKKIYPATPGHSWVTEFFPPPVLRDSQTKHGGGETLPATRRVIMGTLVMAYVDGACSGNPGPAGVGVALVSGKHQRNISQFLGRSAHPARGMPRPPCLRGARRRLHRLPHFALDSSRVWPYYLSMAVVTIKSTYSLDPETVSALEEMARRWGVSKSEALRRAIRAASSEVLPRGNDALNALDELQRSFALSSGKARAWIKRVRRERFVASGRSEGRRG